MAFLIVADDLQTHLYEEILEEITRADDTIVTKAITAGISEVKGYLSKYDLPLLFGTGTVDATIVDENLKNKTKDVICWNLIRLSNPNIDLTLFRTAYEDAIVWLRGIQKGMIDPEGWPYKPVDAQGFDEGSSIASSSNPKRHNHW